MKRSISSIFRGWDAVEEALLKEIDLQKKSGEKCKLNEGQIKALQCLKDKIKRNGVIIADEVGMGKTRIAAAVAKAVIAAGGRVAVIIPGGLGYQWQSELSVMDLKKDPPLRSLRSYFNDWKEIPEKGWFGKDLVLLTHYFSNWKRGSNSSEWQDGFLKRMYGWLVENKQTRKRSGKVDINAAFEAIKGALTGKGASKRNELKRYLKNNYKNNFGDCLKQCVGIGLGIFDLVIVDEAHKGKGTDSGLNILLESIIQKSYDCRVLGLTATPVEMEDDDWLKSLKRIGCSTNTGDIEEAVKKYKDSLKKLRASWKVDQQAVNEYKITARNFQKVLEPYIIRRDKRSDESVQLFKDKTDEEYFRYRFESHIEINPSHSDFPLQWRKLICAAEALSFCTEEHDAGKRLRRNFTKGYGLNHYLHKSDESIGQKDDNRQQPDPAKQERVQYWERLIRSTLSKEPFYHLQHPAFEKIIECIEEECLNKKQKVIVFGTFNEPLEMLAKILNLREMIRRIDQKKYWYQAKLSRADMKLSLAVLEKLRDKLQSNWNAKHPQDKIARALRNGERKRSNSRKRFRKHFLPQLQKYYDQYNDKNDLRAYPVFKILNELDSNTSNNEKIYKDIFNKVVSACHRSYFEEEPSWSKLDSDTLGEIFEDLIGPLLDNDSDEENDEEEILLNYLSKQLSENPETHTLKFATFMSGETPYGTRRVIQEGFNKAKNNPRVLVLQSKVGREGLNLHKACKTVFMFHPEWNPGAAEQQVGRVDRLNSLWSQMIQEYTAPEAEIPRIDIRFVVFKQTYDEENWKVLHSRWKDLQAQLHGIVIREDGESAEEGFVERIKEINESAPNFSPL